jgi:MFS family permease
VALVDELWSGVAVSGAPSVERELGLSHRGYVAFAFVLPLVAAAALEAGVALLSDVWGRARLVVLGQGALAASLSLAAWTTSRWGLTLGLALAGASSGVACGAAQALLFTSSGPGPVDHDRAMVRWTLYSAVGDVLTPLVTAVALALGHSYRGAMGAIAVVVAAQCALSAWLLARHAATPAAPGHGEPAGAAPEDAAEPEAAAEPLRAALSRALRMPRLWAWLLAAASCTLLDELVIALAALRLEHDRGASPALAAAAAVTFSLGDVLGIAVTDRAVARTSARRVLVVSAVACALALLAFLVTSSALAAGVALLVVGVTSAPHHPLTMARAYGELPDRPGTVQALGQLFVVVDVAAPLALGVIADRFGLGVAMACLVAQPVVIVLFAWRLARGAR